MARDAPMSLVNDAPCSTRMEPRTNGAAALAEAVLQAIEDIPADFLTESASQALRRAQHEPTFGAVEACAEALLHEGLSAPAETLFLGLSEADPLNALGLAGLAKSATQRKDWPLALARWDR